MYLFVAILALGFLIVVHEAGHYFVARWCGMRVERFSIGFGPGILKRRGKSGTIFQLAPIPFGGFVEIRGMNIAEDVDPDDAQAYPNRPAWQRFVTIFAGPATNYISAVVLAMGLYTCHGARSNEVSIYVESVMADYDAAGKLFRGDRILKVDGETLPGPKTLSEHVQEKRGGPVTLSIVRNGVMYTDVTIKPKLGKRRETDAEAVYMLGIGHGTHARVVEVGALTAAKHALLFPVEQTKVIAAGLYGILAGTEKAEPAGPVRITKEFEKAFAYSWVSGIELLMMLSVYLGLFNLFPLPALDGGRLVFLGYEMVTRRRANPKIEAMVHMSGIMILGIVMILVTLNDCSII